MTNLSLSRIIHFYLYVFALTLDFPSASIKCSTYVTSPTTNQIPETTHTKGREAERQLGFRAETSWEARLSMSSDRRSWAFQQHDKLVQVYKRQACLYEKRLASSPVLVKCLLKPRKRWTEDNNCRNGHQPFIVDETNTSIFLKLIYWILYKSPKNPSVFYDKPKHSFANVTVLHLRPMHQYTHPSAEPKGKAAARNLANVILTASSKGKKNVSNCKKKFIWWTSPRKAVLNERRQQPRLHSRSNVCSTSDQ